MNRVIEDEACLLQCTEVSAQIPPPTLTRPHQGCQRIANKYVCNQVTDDWEIPLFSQMEGRYYAVF